MFGKISIKSAILSLCRRLTLSVGRVAVLTLADIANETGGRVARGGPAWNHLFIALAESTRRDESIIDVRTGSQNDGPGAFDDIGRGCARHGERIGPPLRRCADLPCQKQNETCRQDTRHSALPYTLRYLRKPPDPSELRACIKTGASMGKCRGRASSIFVRFWLF